MTTIYDIYQYIKTQEELLKRPIKVNEIKEHFNLNDRRRVGEAVYKLRQEGYYVSNTNGGYSVKIKDISRTIKAVKSQIKTIATIGTIDDINSLIWMLLREKQLRKNDPKNNPNTIDLWRL